MNTIKYIFFIVLIGVFLTPINSIASSKNKTKSCCKKDTTVNKIQKGCCCAKKNKTSCSKDQKSCNGNCGNPFCKCIHINTNVTLPHSIKIKNLEELIQSNNSIFSIFEETYVSSNFCSIWQPPKLFKF
jgi:hypothetical protein